MVRSRVPRPQSGVGRREPDGCWMEAARFFYACSFPRTRTESNDGNSRGSADTKNYDVLVAMVVPYGVSKVQLGGTVRLE